MLLHKLSSQPAHNLSTCCAYDIHEVRTTKPHDAYYRARLRAFVRNVKYVCALGYKQVYIALNMQLQPIFARQAYMQCLQPSQGCARVSRNITIVKHSIIRIPFACSVQYYATNQYFGVSITVSIAYAIDFALRR
ncbi:hypothetical protein HMPREF9248_0506 [Fannyhessea vaginae PB189-T1-4]|uniref:Uncharacterized protein n=1 Tax=Fannyhessea vaginae PB189-T1-4 TaxID=866774 RepID=A0ABP2IXL6_9ACTN|nr:hypothetical protein HMPREF9248_0506 [Fannyhessea vaginae PB189-T1-4]